MYGRLTSFPFLKFSIPFHSGIIHIEISVPFHSIFYFIPYHALFPVSGSLALSSRITARILSPWISGSGSVENKQLLVWPLSSQPRKKCISEFRFAPSADHHSDSGLPLRHTCRAIVIMAARCGIIPKFFNSSCFLESLQNQTNIFLQLTGLGC